MKARNAARGLLATVVLATLRSLAHAPAAFAGWYQGKITSMAFGYDEWEREIRI